jgi:hypothetical protein
MTTTNLGMTLPTVGADQDTWGDELNAALGVIDDQFPSGTFTPTDASGAGLAFTSPVGYYRRVGNVVFVWGSLTFPSTADATTAKIGGLPFTSANLTTAANATPGTVFFGGGSGTPGGASPNWLLVNKNATTFDFHFGGGTALTNANLSGYIVHFFAAYPV